MSCNTHHYATSVIFVNIELEGDFTRLMLKQAQQRSRFPTQIRLRGSANAQ